MTSTPLRPSSCTSFSSLVELRPATAHETCLTLSRRYSQHNLPVNLLRHLFVSASLFSPGFREYRNCTLSHHVRPHRTFVKPSWADLQVDGAGWGTKQRRTKVTEMVGYGRRPHRLATERTPCTASNFSTESQRRKQRIGEPSQSSHAHPMPSHTKARKIPAAHL